MLAHYWKANEVHDVKQCGQKNIQNKAIQTKLNLYIKKYMKKETYSNIVCWIFLCVCVCMYVLTQILWKKTKYWKWPVDYKMYVD